MSYHAIAPHVLIVDVLAIIKGRFLDVVNGRVNLTHGLSFVGRLSPIARSMLDHPARGAQVRQRVQVGRAALRRNATSPDRGGDGFQ